MFVRKKHNRSGSVSIQIIDKSKGHYNVVKTLGSSKDPGKIDYFYREAHKLIPDIIGQPTLNYQTTNDKNIQQYINNTDTFQIRVVGPELVLGRIFDQIGYNNIGKDLFRHLVITRLVYPGSKLKTIDYLRRYQELRCKKMRYTGF